MSIKNYTIELINITNSDKKSCPVHQRRQRFDPLINDEKVLQYMKGIQVASSRKQLSTDLQVPYSSLFYILSRLESANKIKSYTNFIDPLSDDKLPKGRPTRYYYYNFDREEKKS